jgi:hypothetical protein
MNTRFSFSILSLLIGVSSAVHADSAATSQQPTPFIEYHNRMTAFSITHLTYERIKTDALYVGVETWLVAPLNNNAHLLYEGEFRMGYNFFWNGRDHFTPIAGVGFLKDFKEHHHHGHTKPGIVYGTLGFLYDHEFSSVVNLGFNLKGLFGGAVSSKHFDWGNPVIGLDASLPLTFRFGNKRHWDFRLEPFNLLLCGNHRSQNYVGFRSTLGYRF